MMQEFEFVQVMYYVSLPRLRPAVSLPIKLENMDSSKAFEVMQTFVIIIFLGFVLVLVTSLLIKPKFSTRLINCST